jgi:biopolymer transport protein TolQ
VLVSHDLTVFSMIANASIVVKIVMGLLLVASLFSWTYIFMKVFQIRRARAQADAFEREFWSGSDLVGLYQRAASGRYASSGMERIFEAGFKEFLKLKGRAGSDVSALLDGTRRAMKATYQREMDTLESHLSFLATVGSVSPYIGLFGTVWGILRAFEQIGATHQAGIDVVGPGIAEALVTTAAGIIVAIEAMVIYNYFMARLQRTVLELKLMAEEFVELLREQKPDPRSKSGEHREIEATAAVVKPTASEA